MRPRVFYDTRALRRGEVILNVVTPDRPGLLLAITLSFVHQGLEVVASEVRTDQGVASDRFTLRDAAGGAPVGQSPRRHSAANHRRAQDRGRPRHRRPRHAAD